MHWHPLFNNSWLQIDKAFTVCHQFAKWTIEKIWFVAGMKDNAGYHVTQTPVIKPEWKPLNLLLRRK